MIPKNIRRTITVDNKKWEYCITGRYCAKIFLHNLQTNQKMKWYMENSGAIGPADIKTLIQTKQLFGIKERK